MCSDRKTFVSDRKTYVKIRLHPQIAGRMWTISPNLKENKLIGQGLAEKGKHP